MATVEGSSTHDVLDLWHFVLPSCIALITKSASVIPTYGVKTQLLVLAGTSWQTGPTNISSCGAIRGRLLHLVVRHTLNIERFVLHYGSQG